MLNLIYNINKQTNFKLCHSSILIDTNILLWTFYDRISYSISYQKKIYPDFVSNLLLNNKLFTTIYNIFEVFNVIEKNEYEIYLYTHNLDKVNYKFKKFRSNEIERKKIQEIYNIVYNTIKNCISILNYNFELSDLEEYYENFNLHKYDTFDYSLVKCALINKILYILTDDSDFYSDSYLINYINILTANNALK